MARTTLATVVILLVASAWSGEARAQTDWKADSTFSVQLMEPVPGPGNFLSVNGTRIGEQFLITGGFLAHYQYQPFVLYQCEPGTGGAGEPACDLRSDPLASVIEHQLVSDFLFSISFFKLFTVGLAFPVTFWQTGNQLNIDSGTSAGELPATIAPGDLRLHLKFRLFPFMEDDKEGFGLALEPVITAPIGHLVDDIPAEDEDRTGSFLGSGNVTAMGRLIADYYHYPFHVAAQVGYRWREEVEFYSRKLGHQLVYGGAFGWWPIPELELLVETYGWNGFTTQLDQSPIEIDAAVKWRFWGPLVLTAGGGRGIIGMGAPVARAFLGLVYEPPQETEVENPDRDGDTYLNENDGCPDDPEDVDEFQDEDGCSDPDNDADGVLDIYDACPMVPEDIDGFEDEDGCPDLDHDRDGIPTPDDQCPDDPEDFDAFQDEDGCPEPDNDGDTIPDERDVCPDDAEDLDGFQDDDGCPDPDNDMDGVPDAMDQCPDEPETLNGVNDEDGCPDRGTTLVVVTATQIEIKQQINFVTDSDQIKGDRSFDILNVVAAVLRANPQIRVEIQGHTDNRGSHDHNMDLSQRRAASVRSYLIERGIESERMVARGYGPDVPIEDNRTARGREKNRRVEFHILSATGGDLGESMPAPPPAEDGATGEATSDLPSLAEDPGF
ncbi:MAG: OmpA family protein [Deltaproteobacteria bacterium]|nr:OmpA family protein [Deltaproteobacteria bacterium]